MTQKQLIISPTSSPTATPTDLPTPSPTPNPTPTFILTPTPTASPTSVPTPSPTPVPTPSETPQPTSTPIPTPAPTVTPAPTPEPTQTPNPTHSPSPSPDPTISPTSSPILSPAPIGMRSGGIAHDMTADQASMLASNGVNRIRGDVTVDPPATQWEHWDAIYQLAKNNNLSLIGTLDLRTMNFTNFTIEYWNRTVRMAVERYGEGVSAWEIWNEPTAADSICGFFTGTAQRYFDLMSVAYPIIEEYSSAAVLGFGAATFFRGRILS
jgi:hypothetical protein